MTVLHFWVKSKNAAVPAVYTSHKVQFLWQASSLFQCNSVISFSLKQKVAAATYIKKMKGTKGIVQEKLGWILLMQRNKFSSPKELNLNYGKQLNWWQVYSELEKIFLDIIFIHTLKFYKLFDTLEYVLTKLSLIHI